MKEEKINPDTLARIESANRVSKQESMEEHAGRSLSPKEVDEMWKKVQADKKKDKAIMKAEKQRRIRAKNKAKPMGKAIGGHVKGSTIKMNGGGKVKGKGSMLSITIEQKPINKKTMDMIKQAEKTSNVVKMNSGGAAKRGYGKARN